MLRILCAFVLVIALASYGCEDSAAPVADAAVQDASLDVSADLVVTDSVSDMVVVEEDASEDASAAMDAEMAE